MNSPMPSPRPPNARVGAELAPCTVSAALKVVREWHCRAAYSLSKFALARTA